jgi:DNA-binding LacI/PurR family transcriptional regulator
MDMKVTIRDIAKQVGVSPATVSNALNGRGGVGADKQQMIIDTARKMGYNRERAQSTGRKCVRLVVCKRHGQVVMDTQFFAELIEGVDRECHRNGLELIITHIHIEKHADHQQRIDSVLREPHEGILLLATELHSEDLRRFEPLSAPLIVLDNLFRHVPVNTVVMDNFDAGYMGTNRLIGAGHRTVELITAGSPFDINNFNQRCEGYAAAMHEAGLEVPDYAIWRVTPTLEGAYEHMRELIKRREQPLPSAFFAVNDIIAMGCMRALTEAGLRIPEDVSIIGMDDLSMCQITNPPLTTVRVPRKDIGKMAVRRLVEMIEGSAPRVTLKTQVGVTLVERGSVSSRKGA